MGQLSRVQHSMRVGFVLHSLWTSIWSPVGAPVRVIPLFSIGNIRYGHLLILPIENYIRPLPLHSHGPRHSPQRQLGLDTYHGPRLQGWPLIAGYSSPPQVSSSSSLHKAQAVPLLFLSSPLLSSLFPLSPLSVPGLGVPLQTLVCSWAAGG